MTYKLKLKVEDDIKSAELDEAQMLYYLSLLLRGGHKLTVHYDGSGDSGDIDEVLLDNTPVGVLPLEALEVAGGVYRIRSDIVGWCLMETVSDNTSVCLSFDNEGSRGYIEASEEDGCLFISYSHIYKGQQHSFITECSCALAATHGLMKKYKDLKAGKNVDFEEPEELCLLLGLMGIKALRVEKDKYEDKALIVLDAPEADENLEHEVETLTTDYFNQIADYSENAEFSLNYRLEDGNCSMKLDVLWEEDDSEEDTGLLIIEFVLENTTNQKEGWTNQQLVDGRT